MTAWHDGRLVGFDLETTGVDPETARIVSAAIVVVGAGLAPETLTLLADPGVPIPDEAAAVHGITTERARAEGQPAADVVGAVVAALRGYCEHFVTRPLVVFNARYDLTVLDREARRHGFDPLDADVVRVVDPLVLDKWLHRYRKGSRKLDAQAEHYGAELDTAHDAASDALTACRVAWCIGKRGDVIRRVRGPQEGRELAALKREWAAVRDDLDALHDFQRREAEAERVRFAAYKRSMGEDDVADRIEAERGWPVLELPAEATT